MEKPMTSSPGGSSSAGLDLDSLPYLQRARRLQKAYPALRPLWQKLTNDADEGRRLIAERHAECQASPARCAVLIFYDDHVEHDAMLRTAEELAHYLREHPSGQSRRLFIMEDTEPRMVDVLGQKLGVNPLIFSEQINTWNYTDCNSVSHRSLPSMAAPETLFTLRYYEIRTLDDAVTCPHKNKRHHRARMTHAINRRKIEEWRDLELKSIEPDSQHFFVRRCVSFWTSSPQLPALNWDAVVLVDPPMNSCDPCTTHRKGAPSEPHRSCRASCLVLQDPICYQSRKELWLSKRWINRGDVSEVRHKSKPYHDGCPTLIRPALSNLDLAEQLMAIEQVDRNKASMLDEIIFYWTQCPETNAFNSVATDGAVASTYYLLKILTKLWDNQLEFIAYSVANSEWFADDHGANLDAQSDRNEWKQELAEISEATKDINYQRRKMGQFNQAITLNMERMGMQLGDESVNDQLPLALRDAQKDFLALSTRLKPLRAQIEDLSSIANEVAALRSSYKSLEDGAYGLKLSFFAAIIFPLTLVASMLSMGDSYLPGEENFWVFWAASVPLALVIGVAMMFDRIRRALDEVQRMKDSNTGTRRKRKPNVGLG